MGIAFSFQLPGGMTGIVSVGMMTIVIGASTGVHRFTHGIRLQRTHMV